MDAALAEFLLQHDADEVVALLQEGGVASAKVAGARDIADNPQLAARGYWERVPGGGVMPGYPLREFRAFEGATAFPPPACGRGRGWACYRERSQTGPPLTPPASGRGTVGTSRSPA